MLIAALVVSADPRGQFGWVFGTSHQATDQLAPEVFSRIHKPLRLSSYHADAVILGTSRAEIGLPATDPVWSQRRVYNFAFSGASPSEIRRSGQFAIDLGVKEVFLTLDMPQFIKTWRRVRHALPPTETGFTAIPALVHFWSEWFSQAFSASSLRDSYCADHNLETVGATVGADGVQLPMVHIELRKRSRDLRQYYLRAELPYWDLWHEVAPTEGEALKHRLAQGIDELNLLLKSADAAHVQVQVVILPVHPFHWRVIEASGRLYLWETWLQALKRLATKTPVADFTLIPMLWSDSIDLDPLFVDPSHLSPVLGRRVISDVLGETDSSTTVGPLYWTPDNVEDVMKGLPERLSSRVGIDEPRDILNARFGKERGDTPARESGSPKLCRLIDLAI